MKITDSLVALVGDFAGMKRTPDYKPSTLPVDTDVVKKPVIQKPPSQRRHSLLISVGTEEIPRLGRARTRSESIAAPQCIEAKLYNKASRRLSAPCVSTAAASVSLRKKLQKMREERNSDSDSDTLKEEDEEEIRAALAHRRASSGSAVYRI
ncbi:hypothetical protein Y032_0768g2192 [Ancylostoma ceylanicum]|uniref:Uncharacterized protein n=1 Tax=Ancylostoma ceylanicum TaxID=53326 RepID=A0A016WDN6_9BILA|nr:hypothetical protein Y032_0768g2192 [Ancylostoma ceylanicum]